MQQRALDTKRKVKVRCVHREVADYPLVPVSITFQGKTHRMEVAVNFHLKHPLILGTDWPPASEETRASEVVKPPELDDFPLEQSRDETLNNAYDRVRSVDRQPDVPLSFPYFSLIKERLYRVTQDAQSKEMTTQLLVPRSTVLPWQATWGRQRHANASWPDSFGWAFTRTSAGGVRRVMNVSW